MQYLNEGEQALLANRLGEAAELLEAELRHDPGNGRARRDLAEVAYRRDDFAAAAVHYRHVDALMARKMELFDGRVPYLMDDDRETRVPFEVTDPLPVLMVRLDDRVTVPMFLDTGGHEIYLDHALADELGVQRAGSVRRTYPGGQEADEGQGRLEAVALGELEIRHVPVRMLDFTGTDIGGFQVRGAVGSAILQRRLATIDYPGGALILRPRSRNITTRGIPFLLDGTHYVLAEGTINGSEPRWFFVDTGGGGLAFVAPKDRLDGVTLKEPEEGRDGGGAIQAVPFDIDELTLGHVRGRDLTGYTFPGARDFFPEVRLPLGGAISHQFFRPYRVTFDFTSMRLEILDPDTV
ncbi:aspartyl protease family protein [Nonomuraea sp. NPDC050663]|uniref:aspartyl protease family protein n=1 Tax=Nonomuraea sp. NPDC050663 TaxID=3364370 RepID=UPI0037936B1A